MGFFDRTGNRPEASEEMVEDTMSYHQSLRDAGYSEKDATRMSDEYLSSRYESETKRR